MRPDIKCQQRHLGLLTVSHLSVKNDGKKWEVQEWFHGSMGLYRKCMLFVGSFSSAYPDKK